MSGGACYIFLLPGFLRVLYKIGKSNNVKERFETLQTSLPDDIKTAWYVYPTDGSNYTSGMLFFIEKTFHRILKDFRYRPDREFFTIDNPESAIKQGIEKLGKLGIRCSYTQDPDKLTLIHDNSPNSEDTDSASEKKQLDELYVNVSNKLTPKPYQVPIYDKLIEWYSSDKPAGKLILPPGIGKSYLTGFLLRTLPQTSNVLVLVPLISIQEDFTKALQLCGVDCNLEILVYNTGKNELPDLSENSYDVIVYDEAHHMLAGGNQLLLKITARKKLFLTATEKIVTESNEEQSNSTHFLSMNDVNVFGEDIYRMGILDAIEKGLLCDYKIYVCDWTEGLNNMIEQLKNNYFRKKIIMFFNNVSESIRITTQLKELEYKAYHIDGDTNKQERKTILDSYQSDDFSIICNVGVIGEGANLPCIDTVIFMESRRSHIGVIQNIGRGLRTYPGKDFCMVIVPESMLKRTSNIIDNIALYDERIKQETEKMCVTNNIGRSANNAEQLDGIVKIIERNSSNVEKFIRKMRMLQIYSWAEYKEYRTKHPDENLPEHPTQNEGYEKFEWKEVPLISKDPYTIEELEEKIPNLIALHKLRTKGYNLLVDLNKLDNRIDVKLIKQLQKNKVLKKWFEVSRNRR